jgi:carboxyl-terminal processing protease
MRLIRNRVLLLLGLLLLLPSASQAGDLSEAGKRSLRYLEAVRRGVRAYHIEGDKHAPEVYVKAAWESMVKVLEAKKVKSVDEVRSAVLIEALRRSKMTDLKRLVTLLDRFAERVEGVDVEELAEVGAKGMFLPLQDPFSALVDTERLKKLTRAMSSSSDKSLGVGPTRTPEGEWKVAHLRSGYPADDADLRIGDRILAIDGKDAKTLPPTQVMESFKAEAGESVRLTVQREGWAKPHTVTLFQGSTRRTNVEHRMLPGRIGYVRALIFNMTLAREMEKSLKALEAEGMRGLILDLRGNPGGALPACVSVASKFLEGGTEIATMESHHPFMARKQTFRAKEKDTHPNRPLVVLINKASASASEMLSGALKYNKRGVVVGETSFGKGVGQSVMPVGTKLKHQKAQFFYITLMEYYLPGGVVVNHKGVEPDVPETPFPLSWETYEKVRALRQRGAVRAYAEAAARDHGDAVAEALGFSRGGPMKLPGLVEYFRDVKDTDLPRGLLLREICRASRRALERERKKNLLLRPREDRVLCRGVFELCRTLDITPDEVPEYRFVFHLFRK